MCDINSEYHKSLKVHEYIKFIKFNLNLSELKNLVAF